MELSFVSYADNDESLLEGFRRIYMDAFPDIDEREPYDNIKRRISSSDSRPGTVACLLTDGRWSADFCRTSMFSVNLRPLTLRSYTLR